MSENTFTCGDRKEQAEITAIEESRGKGYAQCAHDEAQAEAELAAEYEAFLEDEFDKVIKGEKPAVDVDVDDVPF